MPAADPVAPAEVLNAAPSDVSPGLVVSVIARSAVSTPAGVEDAWASLIVSRGETQDAVLLVSFKAADYGEQAWAQAAKYARKLSERLVVPYRKRRAAERA